MQNEISNNREWWRGAIIYQIYPRSFFDTNQDGIGDLKGITQKLEYIASLGVEAIWLSPFFTSPMDDFGYDVSDYWDVDPIFGTLDDFINLLDRAHALDLKVIIDQVYSHTSDQHKWFMESRQNNTNPKADWYVWADPKEDGSPPNNWLAVFGGVCWTWDSRRQQYYLHNFLTSQPDLNVHNKEVQDALLGVAKFWLDMGVDGFRLDALNFAMHDPALRDNPPAPWEKNPPTRPYDFQHHSKNQSHPDIPHFIDKIRVTTNNYANIFTVAEVAGPDALAEMKEYTANNSRLNSAYSFDFLYADKINNEVVKKSVSAWTGSEGEGWPSWAFSNHDAPRAISRWANENNQDQAAKFYLMLLFSLRGNAFLYQGEELGLPQAEVAFENLQDPEAIDNWPLTLGRDGARTPMPWDTTNRHAGFSQAKPWLPVDPNHIPLCVKNQEENPDSVLHFTRKLIQLRKNNPALKLGSIKFHHNPRGPLVFSRQHDGDELLCVFNMETTPKDWVPENKDKYNCLTGTGLDKITNKVPTTLPPLSGYIAKKSP